MTRRFEHAVVVGASSGMGRAIAKRLAAEGCTVAAVARRIDELRSLAEEVSAVGGAAAVHVFEHDVTDHASVPELFQGIVRELGGLDLIVYAAGVMPPVAFEEFNTDKDLQMLQVNLEGAIAWLNEAAQRFSSLKRGTIIGIGSVAGDRGRSGNPVYATSKAGLHTYLEALRNRIARDGVKVVTIKPGFVDTPMTEGLSGLFWLISANRAAEIIIKKARKGVVTAYVPGRWRFVMWVIRTIPSFLFRRLKV